jgi:hypothetical protein
MGVFAQNREISETPIKARVQQIMRDQNGQRDHHSNGELALRTDRAAKQQTQAATKATRGFTWRRWLKVVAVSS